MDEEYEPFPPLHPFCRCQILPMDAMVAGQATYKNRNGHLPQEPGRTWTEADFDYISGKRNGCRVVFSNDGLVFVTYDHYRTFVEIIGE